MNVTQSINIRRAYKNLLPIKLNEEELNQLIEAAQLAPSCFNSQPWRYKFVVSETKLEEMKSVYSRGNDWAFNASLVIAVYSKEDLDCIIKTRKYYLFDTGMATGFLILKATEMGLIAHPIAGFSPRKVKHILSIPEDFQVIALIIVGKHDVDKEEKPRPLRKKPAELVEIV